MMMGKGLGFIVLPVFAVLMLIGCSGDQSNDSQIDSDQYLEAKETAWAFVKEQGWDDTAEEDWRSAEVTEVVASQGYTLLEDHYVGKEVLSITFQDQANVVAGTPIILVDGDTYEVIGYIPGE
ncbi:hypothetical protein KP77_11210 [Jeotgalibacillus alimentarius]|uniref:DUF4830 domain-containing protein n=1 Tax=Jeotgalibacillus alimentarius TaxID=135826 RepID=A0A0C2SCD0_9BACL|nr:hypothetical protein [Jeotgalibacillus alimentarius]KIL51609.1 hypothetical protein KP77_11210 [Jeotgalibacillus alimentarius]